MTNNTSGLVPVQVPVIGAKTKFLEISQSDADCFIESYRYPSGKLTCPKCGSGRHWVRSTGQAICSGCRKAYRALTGTVFGSAKLEPNQYLAIIALYAKFPKGLSSLQMARLLPIQQRTAWDVSQKIRLAIAQNVYSQRLRGEVEIDGAILGGHNRHENMASKGTGKGVYRITKAHNHNRRTVVICKQRGGRSIPFIVRKESDAVPLIKACVDGGSVIHADGAKAWDCLNELYDMLRIEHKYAFSMNGACTNNAESFNSRMRRMHTGTFHKMSVKYMHLYACEVAWRQDFAKASFNERFDALCSYVFQPHRPLIARIGAAT